MTAMRSRPTILAAVADFAHAAVEEFGAVQQISALFRGAGDEVFFFEDANAQGRPDSLTRCAPIDFEAADHGFDARAHLLVAV